MLVRFAHAFEVRWVSVHAGSANFRVQSFLGAVEDAVDWGAGQRRGSRRQTGDQGTPPIPTAVQRHPRMYLDQDSEYFGKQTVGKAGGISCQSHETTLTSSFGFCVSCSDFSQHWPLLNQLHYFPFGYIAAKLQAWVGLDLSLFMKS